MVPLDKKQRIFKNNKDDDTSCIVVHLQSSSDNKLHLKDKKMRIKTIFSNLKILGLFYLGTNNFLNNDEQLHTRKAGKHACTVNCLNFHCNMK